MSRVAFDMIRIFKVQHDLNEAMCVEVMNSSMRKYRLASS